MDFLSLSLRVAASGSADYLPYEFCGSWSEEDRATVEAAIKSHVPERVDSMFNNWRFWHYDGGMYSGSRATWDMGGLNAMTPSGLAESIADYYRRG